MDGNNDSNTETLGNMTINTNKTSNNKFKYA